MVSSSSSNTTNYTPQAEIIKKTESLSPQSHQNPSFDYQLLSNNNYDPLSSSLSTNSIPLFNYCNPISSGSCLLTNPFDQNFYETLKHNQMQMGFELEFSGLNSINFNNGFDEKMMMQQQINNSNNNNQGYIGNCLEGNAMKEEVEEVMEQKKKKKKREIMEEKYHCYYYWCGGLRFWPLTLSVKSRKIWWGMGGTAQISQKWLSIFIGFCVFICFVFFGDEMK